MSNSIRTKETDCQCGCNWCTTAVHCGVGDNGCYAKGPSSRMDEDSQELWNDEMRASFFVPFDDSE